MTWLLMSISSWESKKHSFLNQCQTNCWLLSKWKLWKSGYLKVQMKKKKIVLWKEASFIFNKYMEMGDCCLFIVIFRIKKAESWQPHARMGKWGSFSFQNVLFLRVEDSFLIWLDKTRQFKCCGNLVNNRTLSLPEFHLKL